MVYHLTSDKLIVGCTDLIDLRKYEADTVIMEREISEIFVKNAIMTTWYFGTPSLT